MKIKQIRNSDRPIALDFKNLIYLGRRQECIPVGQKLVFYKFVRQCLFLTKRIYETAVEYMSGVDCFKGGDYLNTLLNLMVLYGNKGFLYFGLYMKVIFEFFLVSKKRTFIEGIAPRCTVGFSYWKKFL